MKSPNATVIYWFQMIAVAALLTLVSQAHAQVISEKIYQDMIDGTYTSCFNTQRAAVVNANVPDAALRPYCACYAKEMVPRDMTQQELMHLSDLIEERGPQAMLSYLLKGRDINDISLKCIPR